MKGRLSALQDAYQGRVEDELSALGVAIALLEHDMIRVRQAIARSGLSDLLGPVLADYERIYDRLRRIQADIGPEWQAGQKDRWKNGK